MSFHGAQRGQWGWGGRARQGGESSPLVPVVWNLGPGEHTIEIAARSPRFNIDQVRIQPA